MPFSLLEQLFDNLPLGVVVLDRHGTVVVFNQAEEKLARRDRANVIGRPFFRDVAPCMNVKELSGEFFDRIGRAPLETKTEFSFPFPFLDQPRDVIVRMKSIESEGDTYGCLFIEDVSMQRSIERMKETLTGCLVHDLKNPLAAALMNLDFLAGDPTVQAAPELTSVIQESQESLSRLRDMLMNLLDVTRLETNTLPLRRENTDVRQVLTLAVRALNGNARMRDVPLVVDADDTRFVLDGSVIRRAVENLLDNAIRYAPKNQPVVVRARLVDTALHVEVQDQGPGIPAAARQAIFEKFAQVQGSTGGEHNRGLGLTFVRLVARAHGGDAEVVSPPSGGTIFRLVLPTMVPLR